MLIGDRIQDARDRSKIGEIVNGPQDRLGCATWRVRWDDGSSSWMAEHLLEPFQERRDLLSLLRGGAFGGMEDFVRNYTHRKLLNPVDDTLYILNASRTQLLPHQFKPLMKFLDSIHRRYLIADEVGLGKTIEAGIILSELRARDSLGGVLIICPNHLRDKWHAEMLNRFDERMDIIASRQEWLKLVSQWEQTGTNTARYIVGHKTLASRSIWEATAETTPGFDLLIVDEAHHFKNTETLLRRILGDLVDASRQLLLLTATPLQTASDNLLSLLRLLDYQAFERRDMYAQRLQTNAALVTAERLLRAASAETAVQQVQAARRIIEQLDEYSISLFGMDENAQLTTVIDRLKAADKIPPTLTDVADMAAGVADLNLLAPYVTRTRKAEVQSSCVRRVETISPELTTLERKFYDETVEWVRERIRIAHGEGSVMFLSRNIERRLASSLVAFGRHLERLQKNPTELLGRPPVKLIEMSRELARARDSKVARLIRLLHDIEGEKPDAKVLVFASFHATLHYLSHVLRRHGVDHELIHGGIAMAPGDPARDERGRRVHRFLNDSACKVLLSANVGGEGLDLQRASSVVNFDLPWNPATVEQRIGRIDRFGQVEDVIHIRNFVLPDTVEDVIYGRLFERLRLFEITIGDFAEVLGPIVDELSEGFLRTALTAEEQEEQLRRAEWRIENERQQLDAIAAHEHELVAFDEDFSEQLRRLDRQGQTIRPEDLRQVIEGTLARYFKRSRLQPLPGYHTVTSSDASPAAFELVVDSQLRSLIQSRLQSGDSTIFWRLIRRIDSDEGLLVTFDGEVAEQDPALELLTSRHPFVRLLVAKQDSRDFHRLAAVRVSSTGGSRWSSGLLALFDARFTIGTQHRRFLKPVWVTSGEVTAGREARELLRTALDHGKTVRAANVPPGDALCEMLRQAEDLADAEMQDVVDRILQKEQLRIRPRVTEVTDRYARRIERQTARLAEFAVRYEAGAHDTKKRQSIEQYIRRLERERDALIRALTDTPPPERHLEAVGAAWLEFA